MIGRLRGWLRGRRPRPLIPPQPRSDPDWAPGDLAECIAARGGFWFDPLTGDQQPGPRFGEIARVRDVYSSEGAQWLVLPGFGPKGYSAGYFRKLRPCTEKFAREIREGICLSELVE